MDVEHYADDDLNEIEVAELLTKAQADEETPSGRDGQDDDLDNEIELESDDEEVEGSEQDDSDDAGDPDPETEKKIADDEADVEFVVDGKTSTIKVKDLRRLAGQEQALTKKSQALAEVRRATEASGLVASKTLEALHAKAVKALDAYKDVDLFSASRELSPEDFKSLRAEMEAAQADVRFLEETGTKMLEQVQANRQAQLREQAKLTVAEITNPTSRHHIPGWNDALYSEILTYSVQNGLEREVARELVDPAAITLIHKAMLYDKAKAKAKGKVKAKIDKTPTRSLTKGENSPSPNRTADKLRKLAAETGDIDDIVALMQARDS
jgi:hypothetical protein